MRLVLLGLPGAGKGTQGDLIAERYGIPHIASGSLIRDAVASGSELGRAIESYMRRGELVPDELTIDMVSERLSRDDCAQGWILDGFPRTVRQAIALDERLAQNNLDVQMALEIRIDPEEAIARIARRMMCSSCGAIYQFDGSGPQEETCSSCGGKLYRRVDDTEDTARNRMLVYMRQTHPVVHYYSQGGRLYSIDGQRPIGEVFADVELYLRRLVNPRRVGEAR